MKLQNQLFIFLMLTGLTALAQTPDITGYVRTYEGVALQSGDFNIIQQTLNLNFEKRGEKVFFKANPMLYHYNSDSIDFRLRELYLDMYFKKFDIRVGKQQVVWGKADGVFITDVVSPLNLTEFLLPDFNEIRMGVIAAKLNYYIGNNIIEAIWIPQFTPGRSPPDHSIWYIRPEFPLPPVFDLSKSEIKPSLKNSEFFLKYSALTSKIDFELMGGYTRDDFPAMHTTPLADTSGGIPTGIKITPEYHRLILGGGSLSTEIKGVVLRSEAAWYNGKYFQTENPQANESLVKKNYLHYLIGADFIIKDIKFSTQFIQEAIMDYDDMMVEEKLQNTMTFLARYDMFRETLHLELFSYLGLNNEDALVRPKVTYDFDDSFSVLLGANLFMGNDGGRFGQYKDNSMIYTKIKYNF